ncbi:MAG TPA: hypothetical protein GXZ45_05065 [Propionibacterium sp.]|nr:hypothetical protein [Propionibacterium sp.]
MHRDGLLEDLKALHHGRGLRRPHVRSWVGPDLLEALDAAPHHTDAELRVALARLLARHTHSLPRDLRHLFRTAVGLEADLPLLEQRIALVAEELDRSPRVLRRRLREAEVLIADAILHVRGDGGNWWDSKGWQWMGVGVRLVLREDAVVTLDQEVLALSAQQKFIHEMFTIPGLTAGEEPVFEAVAGVDIVQVERPSLTSWRLSMELPREMGPGETLDTTVRVLVPRASALEPYVALAPVREYSRAAVEVDFGAASAATSYWVLDGVLPTQLGPAGKLEVPPDAQPAVGRVRHEFTPRVGLVYGIAWLPNKY